MLSGESKASEQTWNSPEHLMLEKVNRNLLSMQKCSNTKQKRKINQTVLLSALRMKKIAKTVKSLIFL